MSSPIPASNNQIAIERAGAQFPKYLHRRGKNFYFKRRIPTDVAHGFPQFHGQVWKSLDTDFLAKAKVFLAVEITEFDLTVAGLRRARAQENAGSLSDRKVGSYLTATNAAEDTLTKPVTPLAPALNRAPCSQSRATVLPNEAARPACAKSRDLEPVALQPPTDQQSSSPDKHIATPKPGPGSLIAPTMFHLFEDWKRNQTRPRTINAVHTAVMEFRTLHGPLAVQALTKQHARAYRDHLIGRRLSKLTVENRLGFLSTLMRYGMREMVEHLSLNPFERIDVTGAQGLRAPKDRRAYNVSELNTIFSSRLYTDDYRPDGQALDASYWAPILGPFVGARIEEICQLRIEDVQRINGVWCLRICDLGEDQKVKTANSFRRVPLHEAVIKSGFLVFVARMAKAGHERVFPTLTNENANGIYSNALGKWFGRYLETIGLEDHRLDYHSYRYTFRQQCSLCGIENEVRDALTGHWVSNNDAGRTYMKGENRQYPFPKLTSAVQLLRYDELRISHIFVKEPMQGVEAVLLK